MPADETPADRLRAAAGYIRDHFGRNMLADDNGNVCAVGAILQLRQPTRYLPMEMLLTDRTANAAVTVLADHIRRPGVEPCIRVSLIEEWSDGTVTDGNEVAEAMEKAAAAWEEGR